MTQDYYEPHPRLTLDQPLVLVGHPGAGVSQVARAIAGRTGLTFSHIERLAESRGGASRAKILVEEGLARLRDLEASVLEQAIRRQPFGVVAMESGLLVDPDRRSWLRERSSVVYIRRPDPVLWERIREQRLRSPGSLPEFLVAAPQHVEELGEYLSSREIGLSEVDVVVEADDRHPHEIAGEILASLDRLVSVVRIGERA